MKATLLVSDEKRLRSISLVLYLCIFAVGELFGALYAKHMSAESVSQTASYVTSAVSGEMSARAVFFSQLTEQLKWVAVLYFLGWTRWSIVGSSICVAFKGYLTGFAASFLFGAFGTGGMPLLLWLLLPTFFIWLPCYFHMTRLSVRYGKMRAENIGKKRENFWLYTLAMFLLFLILAGECALEGWLIPHMI